MDAVHALGPRRALQRALGPCVPCLPSLHQGAIPPAASGDWSPLAAVLALELEGALRPMALRDTEALGMAHALQVRIPLLDHRVVRAALQGARAGGEQAWIGKQAWRKLAARVVPAQALLPGVPHWKLAMARELRDPLAGFVAQGLDSLEQRRLLEGAFVRAVRGQAARGMRGWRRAWSLSALGHWVARHGVEDVAS
ncbi:MAG: asparagine synthase-related protein [Planctomycetia bacterium]